MEMQTRKIAVVDDSELFRHLIETALASISGMDVSSFGNGLKAWMALQEEDSADIVLTDVNMPEMDGLELLKKIKARNPEKPCIIMSGVSKYKKAARDLHADGFLSKPFPVSDLFKMVGQFA